MIRKATHKDIKKLAEIWFKTSIIAHDFIPEKYWTDNKSLMEEQYLPNSEVYLAEKEGYILGFVALIENHIVSIFVDKEQQGKGTGSLLLNYAKDLRTELTLNVYHKNQKSVNFYKAKGFKVVAETIDKPTGEKEFKMHWKNTER